MQQTQSFDFDAWMELAQSDSDAFERKRQEQVEQVLESAPTHIRERLRCLQWRIDRERERCTTSLDSCQQLFDMMWDRVYGDGGLLDSLNGVVGPDPMERPLAAASAKILPFRSRRLRSSA